MKWSGLVAAATAMAACGARTGLDLPDVAATTDAGLDVIDVADVHDVHDVPPESGCRNGSYTLEQRAAEVVLVIDRSGTSTGLFSQKRRINRIR